MRFTLKLVVLFSLIIYLTTGVALYNKALLEVMYWPFYQDNFVLGFMLIGLACFIVLSSFLDEELLQKWFGFDKLDVTDHNNLMEILSNMTAYDTIKVCYKKEDIERIFKYHHKQRQVEIKMVDDIEKYKKRNQELCTEMAQAHFASIDKDDDSYINNLLYEIQQYKDRNQKLADEVAKLIREKK